LPARNTLIPEHHHIKELQMCSLDVRVCACAYVHGCERVGEGRAGWRGGQGGRGACFGATIYSMREHLSAGRVSGVARGHADAQWSADYGGAARTHPCACAQEGWVV
jgi:hypothetical protein